MLTHSVYKNACLLDFTGSEAKVVLRDLSICQQEPVLFVCERSSAQVISVSMVKKHRRYFALLGLNTALIWLQQESTNDEGNHMHYRYTMLFCVVAANEEGSKTCLRTTFFCVGFSVSAVGDGAVIGQVDMPKIKPGKSARPDRLVLLTYGEKHAFRDQPVSLFLFFTPER